MSEASAAPDRSADLLQMSDQELARDPTNARAWNNRGVALARLKCCHDALSAFERATELDPTQVVVLAQ